MTEATGYTEVVVAEGVDGSPEFRKTVESEPPGIRDVGDYGWGNDLKTPAWEEVRDRLNPADFEVGTQVATIHYNLDAWEYHIQYHVDDGLERLDEHWYWPILQALGSFVALIAFLLLVGLLLFVGQFYVWMVGGDPTWPWEVFGVFVL